MHAWVRDALVHAQRGNGHERRKPRNLACVLVCVPRMPVGPLRVRVRMHGELARVLSWLAATACKARRGLA